MSISTMSRRRRTFRWVAVVLCLWLIALNAVAFMHARAMTHFSRGGERTANPDRLSRREKIAVLFTGVTLPRPENHRTPTSLGMEFETERIPSSGGTLLEAWRISGTPRTQRLFLFHGYGGCKDGLLEYAKEFHERGFEVWLVDFRGSGGSSGSETSVGYAEADDVAATVRFATERFGPRKILLYGVSMGAAAVLRSTHLKLVQPDALILECPFDTLIHTVGNRFHLMGLPAAPLAQLLVAWGGIQEGFNGFAHNPIDYASDIHIPTLLMQGGQDSRVTVAQAQAIAGRLGATATFHVFPNLGHESYLSGEPKEWREVVHSFLDTFETGPGSYK